MKILQYAITLLAIISVGTMGYAQNPMYSRLEAKFTKEKPAIVQDSYVKIDFEGDTLSVVKIKSRLDSLVLNGNIFEQPKKVPTADGYNYFAYITEGSKTLTIRHESYHEVKIEFPKQIDQKELWEIEVTGTEVLLSGDIVQLSGGDYKYKVNIDTDDFTQLYIDEELYPNKKDVQLEEGTHYVTAKYAGESYSKKVNVKENDQYVDAHLGGMVTVKNASSANLEPLDIYAPNPKLYSQEKKSRYDYGEMLGQYKLTGKVNLIALSRSIVDTITVNPRSRTVLRLDEMIPYSFILFHGNIFQPWGGSIGYCKNYGLFVSFNTDSRSKIDTPYGETSFTKINENKEEEDAFKSTAMTFSAGPMFRLWRKLYMQAGIGCVYYLSTSEPKMLTADYKYKYGISSGVELLLRMRQFAVGVGYTRQFVENAYNPNIANQLSFSIGFAIGK